MEEGKEREKELEMKLEDKTEQVRIVEKKSNGLVGCNNKYIQLVWYSSNVYILEKGGRVRVKDVFLCP